jgi:hypothetical protein
LHSRKFEPPDAVGRTATSGPNDHRDLVGDSRRTVEFRQVFEAYVRRSSDSQFDVFTSGVVPVGISTNGAIVGYFRDASAGFLRDPNGSVTRIRVNKPLFKGPLVSRKESEALQWAI